MNSHNNTFSSECVHDVVDVFGPSVCRDLYEQGDEAGIVDGFENHDDRYLSDDASEESVSQVVTDDHSCWDMDEAKDRFAL